MTYNPSGRVQLVPQGHLLPPGQCAVCGTTKSEAGFADPQLFIEFVGQLYFCEACAVAVSSPFGAEPLVVVNRLNRSVKEVTAQRNQLQRELTTLKEDNAALRRTNAILNRDLMRADIGGGESSSSVSAGPEESDSTSVLDELIADTADERSDEPSGTEPVLDEPVKDDGPGIVSAPASTYDTSDLPI